MVIPEIQKIVCAAIRIKDTGLIVTGARHYDTVMLGVLDALNIGVVQADQGFIDQWGNFIDRQEAYCIAARQGQYKPTEPYNIGTIYSEDLY